LQQFERIDNLFEKKEVVTLHDIMADLSFSLEEAKFIVKGYCKERENVEFSEGNKLMRR